jgi:hypothetical protein
MLEKLLVSESGKLDWTPHISGLIVYILMLRVVGLVQKLHVLSCEYMQYG